MSKSLILFASLILFTQFANAQCYNLVWADEFNGSTVDNTKWSYQLGASGWGNNELQYYTDRVDNATVSAGSLKIIAKSEAYMGANYTSARMRSINKGDWTYGKMEASIKLPIGQGIWPAFWMMPTESVYGGWPTSGEIDIMEYLGHQPSINYGTCHFGNSSVDKGSSGNSLNISPASYYDGAFHIFSVEWEPTQIRWYVDGNLYHTFNAAEVGAYTFPFDQDFHFILNLAVGGNWPGNPDGTTVFPQTMEVDYVRTYQLLSDIAIKGETKHEPYAMGTVYTVPNLPSTTYTWTVPASSTITAGAGTNEITVDWGTTGGTVEVVITNACGTATPSKMVSISANQATNPSFEFDFSNWYYSTFNGAAANWNISTTDVHNGSKAMCATVTNLSPNNWDIQISPDLIPITAGEEYTLRFWAKADVSGRAISLGIINSTTYAYYTGTGYTLTDTWAEYEHTFTASATATTDINIQFGHELGTYCLDDFLFAKTALLPIQLTDFSGVLKDRKVVLNWETATESDFSHFELERSEDKLHFEKLARIEGQNTFIGGKYHFIDEEPKSANYYRLKQVDLDGQFVYSKIIFVGNNPASNIVIYPTIANSFISIEGLVHQKEIQVYDINGRLVLSTYNPSESITRLDISSLDKGMYFVKIEGHHFKFIKQ